MQELITIKKDVFEDIKNQLAKSVRVMEDIEFKQGIIRGRREIKTGENITLKEYEKKHGKN